MATHGTQNGQPFVAGYSSGVEVGGGGSEEDAGCVDPLCPVHQVPAGGSR